MRNIALLALAVLFLAACAASRPLSLSAARGFCNTASVGDSDDDGGACKDQIELCGQFFDPLAAGVKDRADCLAHCRATYDGMFHTYAADPCRNVVIMARDYCEVYCRGNLPSPAGP